MGGGGIVFPVHFSIVVKSLFRAADGEGLISNTLFFMLWRSTPNSERFAWSIAHFCSSQPKHDSEQEYSSQFNIPLYKRHFISQFSKSEWNE